MLVGLPVCLMQNPKSSSERYTMRDFLDLSPVWAVGRYAMVGFAAKVLACAANLSATTYSIP